MTFLHPDGSIRPCGWYLLVQSGCVADLNAASVTTTTAEVPFAAPLTGRRGGHCVGAVVLQRGAGIGISGRELRIERTLTDGDIAKDVDSFRPLCVALAVALEKAKDRRRSSL